MSEPEKQKRGREDDGGDAPFIKRAPGVCPYFSAGRCTYGASCKYLHSEIPMRVPQVCPYFPSGRCTKGTECRMLHQGAPVQRTANLAPNNAAAFLGSVLQQLASPLTPESITALAALVGHSQQQNFHAGRQFNNLSGAKRGQNQICKHHQLGTCTWGAECRFSHGGKSTTVCPYYPQGRCARGDECRMAHEGSIPQDRVPKHLSTNTQMPEPQIQPQESQMPQPESERKEPVEEPGEEIHFPAMTPEPTPETGIPSETAVEQNEQVVEFNQDFQNNKAYSI
eukprot:TRINITY_DN1536_c2_g2_i1.p1 TRINITY_DN1536_c2_g2~~TRINITY_DN1536_c2_g2_i1.p1  ORF type:complete len:282 (+),score=48.03 TRINITY_DN1536_c2_g2_i1:34-879(+)